MNYFEKLHDKAIGFFDESARKNNVVSLIKNVPMDLCHYSRVEYDFLRDQLFKK